MTARAIGRRCVAAVRSAKDRTCDWYDWTAEHAAALSIACARGRARGGDIRVACHPRSSWGPRSASPAASRTGLVVRLIACFWAMRARSPASRSMAAGRFAPVKHTHHQAGSRPAPGPCKNPQPPQVPRPSRTQPPGRIPASTCLSARCRIMIARTGHDRRAGARGGRGVSRGLAAARRSATAHRSCPRGHPLHSSPRPAIGCAAPRRIAGSARA